jgi:hypothetical protein
MSDEKAIALQLADAIWPWPGISSLTDGQARKLSQAAAELRRLHDLVDKYKWQVRDTCVRAEKAEAQRDELLAAWQRLLEHCDMSEEHHLGVISTSFIRSLGKDAIAKAEGKS